MKYIRVQIASAVAMSLGMFRRECNMRPGEGPGGDVSLLVDLEKVEGYKVIYETGKVSWLHKDIFEGEFVEMDPSLTARADKFAERAFFEDGNYHAAVLGFEQGWKEHQQLKDQDIVSAYWAGFNQSHYSHVHPDQFPPKEMISAGKEWFEKTYHRTIHIHHSGVVVAKEGDDIL